MLICIYKQKKLSIIIANKNHSRKSILKITLPIKQKSGKIDEKALPLFFQKEEK
jgi:hypothetical protein